MAKKRGRPPIEVATPKWFSLEKYEAAGTLDPLGWLVQLELRAFAYGVALDTFDLPHGGAIARHNIRAAIEHAPIMTLDHSPEVLACCPRARAIRDDRAERFSRGVWPTTVAEVRDVHAWARELPPEDSSNAHDAHPWYGFLRRAMLTIDLSMPAKTIKRQFEAFLAEVKPGAGRPMGDVRDNLINAAVLPYLDLKHAAPRITNRQLVENIYPSDEVMPKKKFERTTKPWADQCLSASFLNDFARYGVASVPSKIPEK